MLLRYGIPSSAAYDFEKVVGSDVYDPSLNYSHEDVYSYLMNKTTLCSPETFLNKGWITRSRALRGYKL